MFAVGTWNLENLYRAGTEFGPKTQAAYDQKLDTLAATMEVLAPDVLAVQEVGQPAALDDLVQRLSGSWTTTLSAHPDPRGIRVGFLSRSAPTTSTEIVAFPQVLQPVQIGDAPADRTTVMGRGGLHIHLQVDGAGWDLITVHLKSKLLPTRVGASTPSTRTNAPGSAATR